MAIDKYTLVFTQSEAMAKGQKSTQSDGETYTRAFRVEARNTNEGTEAERVAAFMAGLADELPNLPAGITTAIQTLAALSLKDPA